MFVIMPVEIMSHYIFLDSDSTDLLALKIKQTAESLFDFSNRLNSAFIGVEWVGPSKETFLQELHRKTSHIKSLADKLDALGFQLSQETETWLYIGSRFDLS